MGNPVDAVLPLAGGDSPSPPRPERRIGHWLLALCGAAILVGSVWLVYASVIQAPIIVDDHVTIGGNPSIVRLWPLWRGTERQSPLNPSPSTPVSARPLVNLSFAIDYHFWGRDPTGYHSVNIVLHVLSSLLLWALVNRTLRLDFFVGRYTRAAGTLSFLAALVWALHPLNTESVAYITQRTESMMGLFYLATIYASLRYWEAQRPPSRAAWLVLATLACLAGSLSKEAIASAPAVALAYERTFLTGSFWRSLRRSWPLYVGLLLSWIPLVAINMHGPRTPLVGFHLGVPGYVYWLTQTKVLLLYLKLTFWPWPLVIHYMPPLIETLSEAWPWVLANVLLGLLIVLSFWRRTAAGFVGVCAIAVLSPTLVVPMINETVAERRMYLPLAAIVALVVVGFYELARRTSHAFDSDATRIAGDRAPVAATATVGLAVAIVFGLVSARRLAAYEDAVTLLQDALTHQPDDYALYLCLGAEFLRRDQPEEALVQFEHGLRLKPDSPVLHSHMGAVHEYMGKLQPAIDEYRLAVELQPDYVSAQQNLGVLYYQAGKVQLARRQYEEAIRLQPDFAIAHYNLGLLHLDMGDFQAAREQFEEALLCEPDLDSAHANLATLLATDGRFEEAIPHLQEWARLHPNADSYVKLVDAYVLAGQAENAARAAKTAVDLARSEGHPELASHIEAWLESSHSGAAPAQGGEVPASEAQ